LDNLTILSGGLPRDQIEPRHSACGLQGRVSGFPVLVDAEGAVKKKLLKNT
jgi:hypothetical protein